MSPVEFYSFIDNFTNCIRFLFLNYFSKSTDNIVCELQGLMFGYATDETEECMPLTVVIAHKLNEIIAELRRNGVFWWARPDTKTQVI